MKEVKVKCGNLSYNNIIYKNGEIVKVDENLSSIKTLISFGDLEIVKEETKVEEKVLVDKEEPVKVEKKKSKKSIF